jgi:O-antigen ligase
MTASRFRVITAWSLLGLLAFAILAFGATDTWALMILETGVFVLAAIWAFRVALGAAPLVWNPFLLPLGLLALWAGVQHAFCLSVYRYRTGAEALKWSALWLLFALAAQALAEQPVRRQFGRALMWLVCALCVFGLLQKFTSPEGVLYWSIVAPVGRVFGPFVNANHFAALIELVAPTAALLAARPGEQRLIHTAVLFLLLASAVVCASRMGIVLVGLEVIVVLEAKALFARRRPGRRPARGRLWITASAAAVAAALVAMVSGSQVMLERFQQEQPYAARWTVVQATWKLFLSRPWTGFGAGTFSQVYPSAAPLDVGLFWPHAHNDPVQFAMEWGVAGPFSLLWMLWLLFRRRWEQDQWLRAVLPVIAVLIHSWVDFPLQVPAVMAAWLLTLALLPHNRPAPEPFAPAPLSS